MHCSVAASSLQVGLYNLSSGTYLIILTLEETYLMHDSCLCCLLLKCKIPSSLWPLLCLLLYLLLKCFYPACSLGYFQVHVGNSTLSSYEALPRPLPALNNSILFSGTWETSGCSPIAHWCCGKLRVLSQGLLPKHIWLPSLTLCYKAMQIPGASHENIKYKPICHESICCFYCHFSYHLERVGLQCLFQGWGYS